MYRKPSDAATLMRLSETMRQNFHATRIAINNGGPILRDP
jgi:hypothetical protein